MARNASGLIPARFLTLLSHLTVLILTLYSRENNIKACMKSKWSENEFLVKDYELVVILSTSIALIGFELIGFLSGVSMFMPTSALVSIVAHFTGSVALSYFIFERWDCNLIWWVFIFSSIFPAIVEIFVGIGVVGLKKT